MHVAPLVATAGMLEVWSIVGLAVFATLLLSRFSRAQSGTTLRGAVCSIDDLEMQMIYEIRRSSAVDKMQAHYNDQLRSVSNHKAVHYK